MIWILNIIIAFVVVALAGTLIKVNKERNELVDKYLEEKHKREQFQISYDVSKEQLADAKSSIVTLEKKVEDLGKENNKLNKRVEKLLEEAPKQEEEKPTEEVAPKKVTTRRTTKKVEPAESEKVEEPKKTTRRRTTKK